MDSRRSLMTMAGNVHGAYSINHGVSTGRILSDIAVTPQHANNANHLITKQEKYDTFSDNKRSARWIHIIPR